jgi:iron complex outermembrane receptor protein
MRFHALWMSASALAVAWSGAAVAATADASASNTGATSSMVQEVVITAERREVSLQKSAIAATVLSGADLIKNGVVTVDQLQFLAPSLTVNNFGQGDDFDIRGIGKGEHNSQTETGVVTYRDGMATFPGYITEEPYYDIASLQILRGPQGTFSGQDATGGAVLVTTNNPTIGGGYNGYLMGSYGNYDAVNVQGAINLPISDTLAARVAFNGDYQNSFDHVTGPWTGDPNLKWGGGRLSLLWTPTSSLKVLFKTDYDYLYNGGYFGQAIINPLTHQVNPTSSLFNFSNNWKQDAGDVMVRSILQVDYTNQQGIDFRSLSGYSQGKTTWQGDIDGYNSLANPLLPNYEINESVDETLWSQEFNIISPSGKPITWVLGAYYDQNNYAFPVGRFNIGVPPGVFDENLNGVNHTQTAAGFGQVSFNLPAGFQVQLGARYSYWSSFNSATFFVPEYITLINQYQNETVSGSNFTGKAALNWTVNENNFLYAFIATGSKPGGLNDSLDAYPPVAIPAPFGQEYVTDYEIGWKASFFDHHLQTQLGGYYNDYQHFQLIIPIANNPLLSTEVNDPNSTKLYGLEASAQARFGGFSFNGGLGLEHSAVGTFYSQDPDQPAAGVTCNPTTGPSSSKCFNLGGNPQTYAPDLTANISGSYDYKVTDVDTVTPLVSFAYISHQWGRLFDNVSEGDYLAPRRILDASVSWTHGSWTTTLYGSNLLDDYYISALLSPIELAGPPRQFGIRVMKTF